MDGRFRQAAGNRTASCGALRPVDDDRLGAPDDRDVAAVHSGVELREVQPPVGAAALLPRQRRHPDQADQRVFVIQQLSQTVAVTLEPRVAPQGRP